MICEYSNNDKCHHPIALKHGLDTNCRGLEGSCFQIAINEFNNEGVANVLWQTEEGRSKAFALLNKLKS